MLSDALNQTIADLYDSVFQIPFATFQTQALEAAVGVVDRDAALWAAGVRATGSIISMSLINIEAAELMRYQDTLYGNDYVLEMAIRNPGLPVRREDFGSEAEHAAMPQRLDFSWASRIAHSMVTAAHDAVTDLSEVIALYRYDAEQAFSDGERERMRLLFPHLIAAWRHRQLLHLYEAAGQAPRTHQFSKRGHAVVDDAGLIYAADGFFAQTVLSQFSGWKGPHLPAQIAALLDGKTPSLAIDGLEFLLTRGEERHILSVASAPGVDQLTHSERRVAGLFAEGHSYKTIAQRIGVSQFTVRNQISAVYRKLDIHSKVELARAIS